MTQMERDWVDAYHAEVWDKVSPRVSGAALEWLRINTAPLQMSAAKPAPQLVAA
jgi:Xaa-Pro aminopeptidase